MREVWFENIGLYDTQLYYYNLIITIFVHNLIIIIDMFAPKFIIAIFVLNLIIVIDVFVPKLRL